MDCSLPDSSVYGIFQARENSRQGSGLPFPSPGDLPHPGIEPGSPALRADTLPSEPPGKSTIGNRLSHNMNEYLKFQIKSLSMELTQHSMFEHCKV